MQLPQLASPSLAATEHGLPETTMQNGPTILYKQPSSPASRSRRGQHDSSAVYQATEDGVGVANGSPDSNSALPTGLVQPSPQQCTTTTPPAESLPSSAVQPAVQVSDEKVLGHARSATVGSSSDLDESSSEVSSSVSPVGHNLSLENLDFYDNGAFAFDPTTEQEQSYSIPSPPAEQQQDLQHQHQHSSFGLKQQDINQQQQQVVSSSAAGRREDSSHNSRNGTTAARVTDPDYEVPQGKLTETQVLLSHADKLHLDRYGFIVTLEEAATRAARAKRTSAQARREQRHVQKWRHMLGSCREDFVAYWASKAKKVKRRVRKGIPDEFRGLVWQYLSGGRELMQQHPGQYAQLLTTTNDAVDMEIMRDLNRTFPNHVFFHQRQGPGQQSLFHVLRAYSAHDCKVGYVQGMGFVTAILLMYMSEEEAFWTLVALLKGTTLQPPLEGMYQAGMPLLQQCLFQFQELLKQENPKLGCHLEQEGVVPSMYCTHWFNTIFAYSLPFEQLLRVWDVFLLEGLKVVFRVGIVLLTSAQEQLIAMPFEKLVGQLNSKTKFPVLSRHPDVLIRAALRIPVSRRLEVLRDKHQQSLEEAATASAGGYGSSSDNCSQPSAVAPVSMGPDR